MSESHRLGVGFDSTLGTRHPLRILVAEDNATNQKVILAMLERLGYSADVVGDGRQAVEAVERKVYDAVFMDVQMPEMNGVEACRRISARWPREQRPRLIIMTADIVEERSTLVAAGMDDHVGKPVNREGLVAALALCKRTERTA